MSIPTLLSSSSSSSFHAPHNFRGVRNPRRAKLKLAFGVYAAKNRDMGFNNDYEGRFVDDNMIVLRMRIRETERSDVYEGAPSDWMGWEKKYYRKNYNSDVCEAMGVLQTLLMNTRPSVALGMLALIALSVPTSAALVLLHLVGMAKGTFAVFLGS